MRKDRVISALLQATSSRVIRLFTLFFAVFVQCTMSQKNMLTTHTHNNPREWDWVSKLTTQFHGSYAIDQLLCTKKKRIQLVKDNSPILSEMLRVERTKAALQPMRQEIENFALYDPADRMTKLLFFVIYFKN